MNPKEQADRISTTLGIFIGACVLAGLQGWALYYLLGLLGFSAWNWWQCAVAIVLLQSIFGGKGDN
jgi:hypothetical protein